MPILSGWILIISVVIDILEYLQFMFNPSTIRVSSLSPTFSISPTIATTSIADLEVPTDCLTSNEDLLQSQI